MAKATSKKITAVVAALAVAGIAFFIISQNGNANAAPSASSKDGAASASKSTAKPIVVAYQTGVDPTKVAQANGDYEAATGANIEWRKFDSGAEVIAAVTSGDVPVGNIGSCPLAAAASQNGNANTAPSAVNKDGVASASKSTAKPIVVAYQTGVDPTKVAQANGDYEAATGANIE